jgi:hypothetical protein
MMTRSFSLLFFWALIQQTNGACESHNWSVLVVRTDANEDHCTERVNTVIVAQIEACVHDGSNGQLNHSGGRRDNGRRRRLLANPEPRKLRTTPLRQRTTPLQQQQQRKLTDCYDCATLGQLFYDVGQGYCADTCSGTCDCDRRLESGDDSQDERNLSWDTDMEPGSQGWYETRMTRRCKWVLKAFAENLSQDADNDCMGDPDSLEVSAYCVD